MTGWSARLGKAAATSLLAGAVGSVALRWSTALNTSAITILTQDQTPSGQLNEVEQVIAQSLAAWTGVSGTTLTPASLQ